MYSSSKIFWLVWLCPHLCIEHLTFYFRQFNLVLKPQQQFFLCLYLFKFCLSHQNFFGAPLFELPKIFNETRFKNQRFKLLFFGFTKQFGSDYNSLKILSNRKKLKFYWKLKNNNFYESNKYIISQQTSKSKFYYLQLKIKVQR